MIINWFYKLLEIMPVPKGNHSENRKHYSHVKPNPSSKSLFTHSQHFHHQLEFTEEKIHQ